MDRPQPRPLSHGGKGSDLNPDLAHSGAAWTRGPRVPSQPTGACHARGDAARAQRASGWEPLCLQPGLGGGEQAAGSKRPCPGRGLPRTRLAGEPFWYWGAASCPRPPARDARKSSPSPDLLSPAGGPHSKGRRAFAPRVSAGVSQQLPAGPPPLVQQRQSRPYPAPARCESWPGRQAQVGANRKYRARTPSASCFGLGLVGAALSVCELQVRHSLSQPGPGGWEATVQEPTRRPGAAARRVGGWEGWGRPLLGVGSGAASP